MKASQTKERLLGIGIDQMSTLGLSGITLGQLASASGLSKSGLFAHFRSKEQLQIELLDETSRTAWRAIVEPALTAAEGLPRLAALMKHWLGWWRRVGLRGGCPVAAALFEMDDMEGEVRAHIAGMERDWRALLGQQVQQAKELGQLATDADIEQIVWEICGIYLSHHASSRFMRDDTADIRAWTAYEALIARHRPPVASPSDPASGNIAT